MTELTCPACAKTLRSPVEIPAGKSIKCPACQTVFQAPAPVSIQAVPPVAPMPAAPPLIHMEEPAPVPVAMSRSRGPRYDDDDGRPRRRRDHPERSVWFPVLIVVGVVVAIVFVVGLTWVLIQSGGSRGPNLPPGGLTINGSLLGVANIGGRPQQVHTVNFNAGRTYTIDLMSGNMDSFLILQDPLGRQIAIDDDGGLNLNSRIFFRAPQSGAYRIIATCLGRPGTYTLRVTEN